MATARFITAVLGLAGAAVLPGCIVQDIHDELVNTNHQLETKLAMLDVTNQRLNDIKADLARTNESLAEVRTQLAATNQNMTGVEKRLEVLAPINQSLDSLDTSLKTVKSLIEKIPFVGAGKDEKDKSPEPGSSTDPNATTEPPKPATPAPSQK